MTGKNQGQQGSSGGLERIMQFLRQQKGMQQMGQGDPNGQPQLGGLMQSMGGMQQMSQPPDIAQLMQSMGGMQGDPNALLSQMGQESPQRDLMQHMGGQGPQSMFGQMGGQSQPMQQQFQGQRQSAKTPGAGSSPGARPMPGRPVPMRPALPSQGMSDLKSVLGAQGQQSMGSQGLTSTATEPWRGPQRRAM